MDYNSKNKAIKLYDPYISKEYCALVKDLPLLTTERADPNKGELWITVDQLKRRTVSIFSLCSKRMYKSIFQTTKMFKKIKLIKATL